MKTIEYKNAMRFCFNLWLVISKCIDIENILTSRLATPHQVQFLAGINASEGYKHHNHC